MVTERWLLPPLAALDPDGAFLRISIQHTLQLALTLVLMRAYLRAPPSRTGDSTCGTGG